MKKTPISNSRMAESKLIKARSRKEIDEEQMKMAEGGFIDRMKSEAAGLAEAIKTGGTQYSTTKQADAIKANPEPKKEHKTGPEPTFARPGAFAEGGKVKEENKDIDTDQPDQHSEHKKEKDDTSPVMDQEDFYGDAPITLAEGGLIDSDIVSEIRAKRSEAANLKENYDDIDDMDSMSESMDTDGHSNEPQMASKDADTEDIIAQIRKKLSSKR